MNPAKSHRSDPRTSREQYARIREVLCAMANGTASPSSTSSASPKRSSANTRRASRNFASAARSRTSRPRFPPSPAPRNQIISPAKRPSRTWHRRQRLVQSRTCRSPVLETIEPPRSRPKNLGRTARMQRSRNVHHAQIVSGGSTCIRAWIIPSRRARCIPPMAGNFSTFIRGRIPSAKKSKKIWANFRSSVFGGRRRALNRRKAPPMRVALDCRIGEVD